MPWDVFQKDVLDALEGYRPFFYRLNRMKELEVSKRVEAVAVVKRDSKEEIWIIDAKHKPVDSIDTEDAKRMDAYEESIKENPAQIGIGKEEFYKYKIFKIFVYQGPGSIIENKRTLFIPFEKLHAFCEKNLILLDTDYVVHHVSRLANKGMLSESQVSLLYSGLNPYEEIRRGVVASLHDLSESLNGAVLEFPPFDKRTIPEKTPEISALFSHFGRDIIFPIIIPYSRETMEDASQRMAIVFEKLSEKGKTIPIAVDSFSKYPSEDSSSEKMSSAKAFSKFRKEMPAYVLHKDLLQWFILKELRVIPIEKIIPYLAFSNIETKMSKIDCGVKMEDLSDFGIYLSIQSQDDIEFKISYGLPFQLDDESKERFKKLFKIEEKNKETIMTQVLSVQFQNKFYTSYNDIYDLRVDIDPLGDFHALSYFGKQVMKPEIDFIGNLAEKWLTKKVGIK
jgi:hypothetical protein